MILLHQIGAANEEAEEFARLAVDAVLDGRLQAAQLLSRHALRSDPLDADAQMARGVMHWTHTVQWGAKLQSAQAADASLASAAAREAASQYARHAVAAATAFKRCLAVYPWDSAAAAALQGVLRAVRQMGPPAADAAARLDRMVRPRDYVHGPTRHRSHRSRMGPPPERDDQFHLPADAALPFVPPLTGDAPVDAKLLWELGYKQKAVRTLCSGSGVRIDVPEHERNISTGAMPPDLSLDLAAVLQVCGFAVVGGGMPKAFVRHLREQNNAYFSAFLAREAATHSDITSVPHLYGEDYTVRSAGRYEYMLPLRNDLARDELLANPWVRPGLLRAMDAQELVVDMLSAITSLPGSPTQHLHKDVGPLYPQDGATLFSQQAVFRRLRAVLGPPPGDISRLAAHLEHFEHTFLEEQFEDLGAATPQQAPRLPAALRAQRAELLANLTRARGAAPEEYADADRFPAWHPWRLTPQQYIAAMTHSEHGFWDGGHTTPPFSVAMVTPLINMTRATGPTTFLPGSHAFIPAEMATPDHVFDREAPPAQRWHPVTRSPLQRRSFLYGETHEGDVILFDVRVQHRGGANRQTGPSDWRSILYCTLTHDWFHDGRNFQPRHTASFDALPPYVRSAVTRIDQHDYVKRMEAALGDAFVDVSEMSSSYEFDTTTYTDTLPLRDTAQQRAGQVGPSEVPPEQLLQALRELNSKHKWHSSSLPEGG